MRSWLARWNAQRKLRRGQCVRCRAVLRDDETSGFCSTECAEAWQDATAY